MATKTTYSADDVQKLISFGFGAPEGWAYDPHRDPPVFKSDDSDEHRAVGEASLAGLVESKKDDEARKKLGLPGTAAPSVSGPAPAPATTTPDA